MPIPWPGLHRTASGDRPLPTLSRKHDPASQPEPSPRSFAAFALKPSRQTIRLQDKTGGERTGRERTYPVDRCADCGVQALKGQPLRFSVRRGRCPLLVIDEVGCISFVAAVDTDDVPQAPAAV